MTTRTDSEVIWHLTPRVILFDTPPLTAQDFVDTIRKQEDTFQGMSNALLLEASGKEDLGGSLSVGITLSMRDAQAAFRQKITNISSGTATSTTSSIPTGLTLLDSTATFIADGVKRGDTLIKDSIGAHATVLSVISETELFSMFLDDSSALGWTSSDAYKILQVTLGKFQDGNFTAVDGAPTPATIDAVFPSFGTFAQSERATSAALVGITSVSGDMTSLAGSALAAQRMRDSLLTTDSGIVLASPAPTLTTFRASGLDVAADETDHFRDAGIRWLTGSLKGQVRGVTGSTFVTPDTDFVTEAFSSAPASGDVFMVV